jgi:flagellar biosynthesis protein FliQ
MDFNMLLEPIRATLTQVGVFLPKLVLALVVLIAGWLLARLARFTVAKGLRAINFNVLTERAGMDGFLKQGGLQSDTTDIFAVLVYWLVIFIALVIAFNGLGLTYITDLLGQVVLFVPKVIVALLIIAFGGYFALFIGNTVGTYCRNVGMKDGELLGSLAQYAIIVFVVLMALDQVSIGGDVVRHSFLILLGGVVLGLALAFGIGGQKWAAGLLERWWPRGRGE